MSRHPLTRGYSLDEYLTIDAASRERHEFWQGAILAMAGGSPRHNLITANVTAALVTRLRGKGCRAYSADQRIRTPEGLYSYADVSVFCGEVELAPGLEPTALNPALLGEVLSPSTRAYDRGEKRELYQEIASLRDLLLVEQHEPVVEHWFRAGDRFELRVVRNLDSSIVLTACDLVLPLSELYEGVTFDG